MIYTQFRPADASFPLFSAKYPFHPPPLYIIMMGTNTSREDLCMNILIAGCGKVGSRLADFLCEKGHDVSIVDNDRSRFELLSYEFSGFTIQGVPIDQDVLRQAGIEGCDAVAALTEDDNTNIMVCQIAREIFHVEKVVGRIYDPLRENIFSQLQIKTICPTNLTVSATYSLLTDHEQIKHMTFSGNVLNFSVIPIPHRLLGMTTPHIMEELGNQEALIGILDKNNRMIMAGETSRKTQSGDRLLLSSTLL